MRVWNSVYIFYDEEEKKDKYSCKGIQKRQNEINKDRFHNVLFNDVKDMCINKGFRVINNEMITYIQQKKGLSYYYDKRVNGRPKKDIWRVYRFY